MLFAEVITLLPGFRFCPTDEELLRYYLKRKVLGRVFPFEVIAEVDLYKYEPWDLPEKSALPTKDLEWYFFIPRDRKYPNGSRTNRATAKGYWKSTGKDRSVSSGSRVVGTKKTLVYYNGRAPRGERSNWVMHEYRLNDVECGQVENGYVLCRVYQKSGLGPKNGEQYGAPVEDDDFDNSPTVEVDGGVSLEPDLVERKHISPNTLFVESFSTQSDDDCVSFRRDMVGRQGALSGFEPRDLNVHFEKVFGDFQQNSMQNFTCSSFGGDVSAATSELVELVAPGPVTLDDEADMLEQLLGECTDQLKSTDAYQNNGMCVENGFMGTGAHLPSDGDFLELNDLDSVSDIDEGKTFVNDIEKIANIGFKAYVEAGQGFMMQTLPTYEAMGVDKYILSAHDLCEGDQEMPEVMEMQPVSNISHDSRQQSFRKNTVQSFPPPPAGYSEDIGPAGHMQPIEPEDDNGLKMFNHLEAYLSEKDIFRGLLECEANSELHLHEGGYFDTVPLFTDKDVLGEARDTNLVSCNDHGIPQVILAPSKLVNKAGKALDDGVPKADDIGSSQGQVVCLEPERRSSSPQSLFWRLMDSLPTLPASAAELSPNALSSDSSILAMGSVSVTCTCIGEAVPASCVNCSVTEARKGRQFVRSVSFVRQGKRSLKRWDKSMLISAVLGGLFAIFVGVFLVSGGWKGWGACMQIGFVK